MIDIHTHILPNVDDGSKSFEMSMTMLKQAKEQGVTHIILTPHKILDSKMDLPKEEMEAKFLEFKDKTKDLGIELILGSEIFYTTKAFHKLIGGELTTINNSKYCLVEFPMGEEVDIEESLYNIRVNGFIPILAHPERYHYLKLDEIISIKEQALIQINSTSILGLHSKKSKKMAFDLLKKDLVDFVASDCHDDIVRKVNLKEAYNIVSKKFGYAQAEKIFTTNQKELIESIK